MIGRRDLLAGLVAGLAAGRAGAERVARGGREGVARRITAALRTQMVNGRIPGGVVIVGDAAGETVSAIGSTGLLDPTPMTRDTRFRLYCLTKPMTGMAAKAALRDHGIDPDAPIVRWLPEFADVGVMGADPDHVVDRGAGASITVAHLLSHSAGIVMPIVRDGPLERRYMELGLVDPRIPVAGMRSGIVSQPRGLKDFSLRLASLPLAYRPGTRFSYGMSYDLLGALLERIEDRPLDEVIARRVTGPLGLSSTSFVVPRAGLASTAHEILVDGSGSHQLPPEAHGLCAQAPSFLDGGSGMVSTPADYARLCGVLASPRGDGLRLDRLPATIDLSGDGLPGFGYATGAYRARSAQADGRGAGTIGWTSIGGGTFWIDPAAGLYVVVMTQYGPAARLPIRDRSIAAAYV